MKIWLKYDSRTKLFGDYCQIVLTGNHQIYIMDLAKNISKYVIFVACFASQGVLNKDPTVWLGGVRSPPRNISKYIKIKIMN
jgi:hypothetical protein